VKSTQLSSGIKEILFVCTGNLCRSVAAESLAKKHCPPDSPLYIYSAGTDAVNGRKSPEDAIVASRNLQADMSAHEASLLTSEMIQRADALFIMEPYHEEKILAITPDAKNKIFYLRNFSGDGDFLYTIDDPYGKPMHVYNECFHLIEQCVKNLLYEIQNS
jgi:protein-tyrosine-phosphatase